ncbi:hypothetical protein SprV_0301089100 [Sparganum proliferum]
MWTCTVPTALFPPQSGPGVKTESRRPEAGEGAGGWHGRSRTLAFHSTPPGPKRIFYQDVSPTPTKTPQQESEERGGLASHAHHLYTQWERKRIYRRGTRCQGTAGAYQAAGKINPPKQPSTDGVLVHNLSSHRFTQPQLTILSYDAKFSTRDARPEDFIASFESALQKCEGGEECKNAMRQQVSTLLLQHKRQMTISKAEDRKLLKIRKLEDIVALPADKGRSTVVMDKAEYFAKLGNLLMDKEAYAPSTVSEFKKLVNSINKTIGKLRKAGALTRREALAAKASDAAMARFYGLPKVRKPGVPLRPIVSLRGTPTFGLPKWLYQRLCFLTKDSEWTVKSTEEFLSRIKRLEVMVSFDVISLFTSIPRALAVDTIDGFLREKYDETDQQLKRVHIIQLLELCLKTFYTFNGQVYEQKKGTPMGSPLSGLIAEAVLQRLERLAFSSYPPKFWARYVDDTFVIIKRSDVQTFKALSNSIFPDIQFTMEEELNNQLAFLDVQVTKLEDGRIRTTVYRKATNTRRILHFKSNHPVGHKRSCVRTLFQRVQTHCGDDNGRKRRLNKYYTSTAITPSLTNAAVSVLCSKELKHTAAHQQTKELNDNTLMTSFEPMDTLATSSSKASAE